MLVPAWLQTWAQGALHLWASRVFCVKQMLDSSVFKTQQHFEKDELFRTLNSTHRTCIALNSFIIVKSIFLVPSEIMRSDLVFFYHWMLKRWIRASLHSYAHGVGGTGET